MCTHTSLTQHDPLPACLLQQAQLKEYGAAIQLVKANNVEDTKKAKASAASAAAVHMDLVSQDRGCTHTTIYRSGIGYLVNMRRI